MFVNWDAEEYGLIGSTEFVEEFAEVLSERAVVYINFDGIGGNTTLRVSTVPMIYDEIIDVTKKIKNPIQSEVSQGRKSLYDTWYNLTVNSTQRPQITGPASYSDHGPFIQYLGIPALDLGYKDFHGRALYHTMYESKFLNDKLFDPTYAVSKASAQMWIEVTRRFADSPILPLRPSTYARVLKTETFAKLGEDLASLSDVDDAVQQFKNLLVSTEEFLNTSVAFEKRVRAARKEELSSLNERLMRVERCFVNPRGVGENPYQRHILYSLPGVDMYSAGDLGAVYKQVKILQDPDLVEEDRAAAARQLAVQISIVHYGVLCAKATLKDII